MKGIELGTGKRMSEVISEVADVDPSRVVVVTGPNLAGEIAFGQPTAAVVASTDGERATAVQHAIANAYFRRTPTTTSSAASSAGRSRMSSPSPVAWPSAWDSATTRRRP
jgi:glycerol-3-phosphate dehydrogenase (NAD(P)+)